jgi:hypothetical protein
MRVKSRDLLLTSALLAGVVFLYALQNSREETSVRRPSPSTSPSPVAVDVPLPTTFPKDSTRPVDRYRQFGLPAASDMILYFPMAPAPAPRVILAPVLKKL